MRTLAADIKRHTGEEVRLSGWVHRIRDLGKVSFVILRDRSGEAQLVLDQKPSFANESVIEVRGLVAANEKAPERGRDPGNRPEGDRLGGARSADSGQPGSGKAQPGCHSR